MTDGRRATGDGRDDEAQGHEQRSTAATADDGTASPVAGRPSPAISRRGALTVLGAIPFAGAALLAQQGTVQDPKPKQTHEGPNQPASSTRQPPPSPPKPKFFTAREARTLRVLADDIIPRDGRSGSATESGVIDFIDFNLSVEETSSDTRTAWRGGLRWLDAESRRRFDLAYAAASAAQRHQILDDIAWPARARPEMSAGVAFFGRARDMVAAGFFSSAMGFKDLQYIGNVFNPGWNGCPPTALQKLGVSYDVMSTRVAPADE